MNQSSHTIFCFVWLQLSVTQLKPLQICKINNIRKIVSTWSLWMSFSLIFSSYNINQSVPSNKARNTVYILITYVYKEASLFHYSSEHATKRTWYQDCNIHSHILVVLAHLGSGTFSHISPSPFHWYTMHTHCQVPYDPQFLGRTSALWNQKCFIM